MTLPTPDVVDPTPIELSATGGKIVLVSTTAPLGCNGNTNPCAPSALEKIVDLVGYGKADFFTGAGPAPETTNTTSVLRANGGCSDTKNNSSDYVRGVPAPRNSASPRLSCASVTP